MNLLMNNKKVRESNSEFPDSRIRSDGNSALDSVYNSILTGNLTREIKEA